MSTRRETLALQGAGRADPVHSAIRVRRALTGESVPNQVLAAVLSLALLSFPAFADEVRVEVPDGESEASIVHREPLIPIAEWRLFNVAKLKAWTFKPQVEPVKFMKTIFLKLKR
jgi:hypothetical protein